MHVGKRIFILSNQFLLSENDFTALTFQLALLEEPSDTQEYLDLSLACQLLELFNRLGTLVVVKCIVDITGAETSIVCIYEDFFLSDYFFGVAFLTAAAFGAAVASVAFFLGINQ